VPEWLAALPKAPDLPAPGQVVCVCEGGGGGGSYFVLGAVLPLSVFFTSTTPFHKTMIRSLSRCAVIFLRGHLRYQRDFGTGQNPQ
jgi:hypothetical protein